ncbi:MAG: hypothetical protein WBM35_10690 [Candidatus Electrothrix sp.]
MEADKEGLRVGIRATGTHHVQTSKVELELLDSNGDSVAISEKETKLMRILPQRRIFVPIPLDMEACSKAEKIQVTVHAEGLDKPVRDEITLKKGTCEPVAAK